MILKKIATFLSNIVGFRNFWLLILLSALSIIVSSSIIVIPFFIELFINNIQEGQFSLKYLYFAGIIFLASFSVSNIINFFFGKKLIKVKNQLQVNIFDLIIRQNPKYIKNKGEGFFAHLMEQSLDAVMALLIPCNLRNFFLGIQNVIIIGILFYKNCFAGACGVVLFILYFFAYILNNHLFSTVLMNYIDKSSSSLSVIYDFIRGNKTLISSENDISFAERIVLGALKTVRNVEFRLQFFFDLIFTSIGNLVQPCINIFIIAILGKNVLNGEIPFGTFLLIISYYNMLCSGLGCFQTLTDTIFHSKGALDSINEFISKSITSERKVINRLEMPYYYKLDSVSFVCGDNKNLANTTIELQHGKHYALVGNSGIGKSNLVNLLLGIEKSTTGNIYFLNDHNDVNKTWVFEDTAWFSQNTDIYNLSLKENIFLGDEVNELEYQELIEKLDLYKLEGRILGSNGENISGGERQRVGLARFLHTIKTKNHYFIDEGFVSLDEVLKQKLLDIVKIEIRSKTGICITHDNQVFKALSDSVILYSKDLNLRVMEKSDMNELIDYLENRV